MPYRKEDIKKIIEERTKVLSPGECALFYDEKRGILISACNVDGAKVEVNIVNVKKDYGSKNGSKKKERRISQRMSQRTRAS